MRVLLDTHTILWWWTEPSRFKKSTLSKLANPETEVLVSSVSAYELAYKSNHGQLSLPEAILTEFDDLIRQERWTPLSLTAAHGMRAGTLDSLHKDPFDRLLAAQAIIEKVNLVTSDPAFETFKGLKILW